MLSLPFFVAFSYRPQFLMTVEFVITKQKNFVALWGSSLLPSKAGGGGWLVGPLSVTSTPPRTCHGNPRTLLGNKVAWASGPCPQGKPLTSRGFRFFIFKMTEQGLCPPKAPWPCPAQILYSVEQKVHDTFKSTKNL